jgi:hypothetical protein
LAGLLLAGCASEAGPDRQAVLQEVMANYRASLLAVEPSDTRATPAAAASPGAPVARPAPSGAWEHAAQMLGHSPDAVLRRLGQPQLRRTEGAVQIWLYQGRHCALDVVMDREPGTPLRVSFAAARASGTERQTEAACLRDLARS